MDNSQGLAEAHDPEFRGEEKRGATRFISLIRSAKLIGSQGEFICVIRDVSATGISLRTFHKLPADDGLRLELQNGETYRLTRTRAEEREASYRFAQPVEVDRLIRESWDFPKRQLRLNLAIPLAFSCLTGNGTGTSINLSQQGAKVECDMDFAIDQAVRVTSRRFGETRAKVRWRDGQTYGLVFDNTLSLRELALLAAAVQCPALLHDTPIEG